MSTRPGVLASVARRVLPPTPIGSGLAQAPLSRFAAAAIGIAVLASDLARRDAAYGARIVVSLLGLGLLVLLARDRWITIGVRGRPLPSWRWWIRGTLVSAAIVALALGAFWCWLLVTGTRVQPALQVNSIADLPAAAWRLCVVAPIVEESVYRVVLVTALVPSIGAWGAIVVSGIAFAGLHHLYGNPGPDNQVAGFLLAWAYLRSGAIWIPVVLHSLGNACALVDHVGLAEGWWHLPGAPS